MKRSLAATCRPQFRVGRTAGCAVAFVLALGGIGGALGGEPGGRAELIASPEPGWPQFRGPRRDGVSDERGLLPAWPEGGPRVLWSTTELGRGYSSPVIAGGRLFLTGDFGEEMRVMAFDLEGRPQWSVRSGDAWLGQYKGARASVTYSAGRLYHQNAHGRVVCLSATDGREQWSVDLLAQFKGKNITWGLSECLLVDERAVYALAGGEDALLIALNKHTGAVLWRSERWGEVAPGKPPERAGYASPILVRFAGRRLLIGLSQQHLFCVDADSGRVQWTRPRRTSYSVLAMMPVLVGDAVFAAAPHGPPGQLHRLVAPAQPDGVVGVEDRWTTGLDTCQGGVVHVAGRLFGSFYAPRRGWTALDAATGETIYEAPGFAKGSLVYADQRLYVLCEDGTMLLVDPAASQFEVKGRFRLVPGKERDVWAHPVILEGRLYLRYHERLQCFDIRAAP